MPSSFNNWKSLLETILELRLGNNNKTCVVDHQDDSFCCLNNSDISKEEIILNILQKDTDLLLERWIIHYEPSVHSTISLIDSLTQFVHTHPIPYRVYAMMAVRQQICYTYPVPDRIIEFRQLARLTASRFHNEAISIQVVLDETNELRPPQLTVRRLSRLSLSAIEPEDTPSIPIMQYNHRNTIAYSTSPIPTQRRNSFQDHGCLVGSFEESLFSGRMSSQPSKPITFHCQLGVLGYDCKPSLKCPPHWQSVFPATFYDLQEDQSTPYVGTVDLQDPGYRIPPKGQIQVVVKNPNKTAVKLFLIPYDFRDMPRNTKTFLRQKSYALQSKNLLRYAVHLHVCRVEKRIYIYRSIRIVFANRIADGREKFKVVCEGPKEPVYVPL